ncbi:broad-specificity NMP kinase [Crossiella equi]|uniref:Broad-specificity NMP kinase n=1 Tax=Crossiella equi TaxID=130796 RepID=A0ABS5AJQ9_9PSEU|nr:AAA family ATPase [Crossiella equi]MBP2476805.1 broad-specificity NMP kinase [Crossiella equi]
MDLKICVSCGDKAEVPVVLPGDPVLFCAVCGHRQPFTRLPMFALTGPSGTGKSTVGKCLAAELGDAVVVMEQDVLWSAGLQDPADDYRVFRATWLRMVAMVNQSGRPVVLCGTVVPVQFERLPERALLGDIHYLALTCEPDLLAKRLRARPAWREWDDEDRIAEMLEFNEWVRATAHTMAPPMRLLDTTSRSLEETVHEVVAWVRSGLSQPG